LDLYVIAAESVASSYARDKRDPQDDHGACSYKGDLARLADIKGPSFVVAAERPVARERADADRRGDIGLVHFGVVGGDVADVVAVVVAQQCCTVVG
jgi:hypothetical protein